VVLADYVITYLFQFVSLDRIILFDVSFTGVNLGREEKL
jgi:hypothetical protein